MNIKWVAVLTISVIVGVILYFTILKDTIYENLIISVVALIEGVITQSDYMEGKKKSTLFLSVIFYLAALMFLVFFIMELIK